MSKKYTFVLQQFNVEKDGVDNAEISVWNTWAVYIVFINIDEFNLNIYTQT